MHVLLQEGCSAGRRQSELRICDTNGFLKRQKVVYNALKLPFLETFMSEQIQIEITTNCGHNEGFLFAVFSQTHDVQRFSLTAVVLLRCN